MKPLISQTQGQWTIFLLLLLVLSWASFEGVRDLPLDADDRGFITDARAMIEGEVGIFSAGRTLSGRPVIEMLFVATTALWGDDSTSYHILAVILHLCAGIAVVTGFVSFGRSLTEGMLTAMLFLFSVGRFEVVHWVACVPYPLVIVFGMISTTRFTAHLKTPHASRLPVASVTAFLAVLTHPSAMVIPFLGLLTAVGQGHRIRDSTRSAVLYVMSGIIPFVGVVWLYGDALTAKGGADAGLLVSNLHRCLALLGYVFVSPYYLFYPNPEVSNWLWPAMGVCLLGGAGLAWRFGYRYLTFWVAVSFVLCAPFSAVPLPYLPLRHVYLAGLGPAACVAWIIHRGLTRPRPSTRVFSVCALVLLLANDVYLLRRSVGLSHFFFGRSLIAMGDHRTGVVEFITGYGIVGDRLTTDDLIRHSTVSLGAGVSPGPILEDFLREQDEGNPVLEALLGVSWFASANPDSQRQGNRLVFDAINRADTPRIVMHRAAGGYYNVGVWLYNTGRYSDAANAATNAHRLVDARWDAWKLKASAYLIAGVVDSAAATYEVLLSRAASGQRIDIVGIMQEATRAKPDLAVLWFQLGKAHYLEQAYGPSLDAFRTAARLEPDHPVYPSAVEELVQLVGATASPGVDPIDPNR